MTDMKWLPLVGYEDTHEISEYGDVRRTADSRSKKAGYVSLHQIDRFGYRRVSLNTGKQRNTYPVHRLVAITFVGECPDEMEVNHKDGNKSNNHYSNLEYLSHRDNCQHSFDVLGRKAPRGEGSGVSKITEDDVREIRCLYASGVTQREIGERYGLTHVAVGHITRGKTWQHV